MNHKRKKRKTKGGPRFRAPVELLPISARGRGRLLKYVEIIYYEADDTTRKFVRECVQFPSDPTSMTVGFTDLDAGVRYRVYPTRNAFESERLRKTCRLLDSARGADIPEKDA